MATRFRAALRALLAAYVVALAAAPAFAGGEISWTATADRKDVRAGETVFIRVKAAIAPTWHLYSMTTPPGGPKPTRFAVDADAAIAPGGAAYQPKPERKFDDTFEVDTELYEGETEFLVPVRVAADATPGDREVLGHATYMVCDPSRCVPGADAWRVTVSVVAGPARPEFVALKAPAGLLAGTDVQAGTAAAPVTVAPSSGSAPAAAAPASAAPSPTIHGGQSDVDRARASGLFAFLVLAVTVGFASLLTPCVFPMIPITISYFTKTTEQTRGRGVLQAGVYALSIVATFTLLGLVVAALFGAAGIARFAANPWVNILLACIFVGLALNLFGFFEILVPGSMLTRLNAASGRGGFVGTILMGFTFTLTSFTCTVPLVGTILVSTAQGDWLWPLAGMLAYSTAFALPFFLLALFPQTLARMPRAGGWMISIKVVMGFLELAAAMKFVSNVDLVWGFQKITRELFLSIWIALAFVTAFYLLGKIRLPHERPLDTVSIGRVLSSTLFLSIAFYLFTGLLGTPLGELDAFLPPISSAGTAGVARAGGGAAGELAWGADYQAAVAEAKAAKKFVVIDFTGYACTNCRWMEKNVFPKAEVRSELDKFVRVQLYTDGQGDVYDRNRAFQEAKFGTVALPLYVVVDPTSEAETSRLEGLTRDPAEFASFLRAGRSPAVAANAEPATR